MAKWIKLPLLAVLCLILANCAFAQGSLYKDIAWRYTPAGAFPASGASVTICTAGGSGTPCTPTVSVFADAGLSVAVSNPLPVCTVSPQFGCIDGLGNFSFYASPAVYTYTITGSGLTPYGPIPINVAVTNGGPASFTNLTVSGTGTFTGTVLAKNFENMLIVDPVTCLTNWLATDIGACLNAAYAACPTPNVLGRTTCKIVVAPKIDGNCYVLSTLVNFTTNGKPVDVDFMGSCADATAITSGTIFTVDVGQAPGIGGRFANLDLLGPCTTTACIGATTIGFQFGTVNGAVGHILDNVRIGGRVGDFHGFAISIQSGGNSYINQCRGCFLSGSAVAINFTAGSEGFKFIGGSCSNNAICYQTAGSGSPLEIIGLQMDGNTTDYNRLASTTFTVVEALTHHENPGCNAGNPNVNLNVITDNVSSGFMVYQGVTIQNDCTNTSSTLPALFNIAATNSTGSANYDIGGVTVGSQGQVVTNVYALGNAAYRLRTLVGGTNPTNIFNTNLTGGVDSCVIGTIAFRGCVLLGPGFTFQVSASGPCTGLNAGDACVARSGTSAALFFDTSGNRFITENNGAFSVGGVSTFSLGGGTLSANGVPFPATNTSASDTAYGTYRVTTDQTITAGASLTNIPGLSWTMPASAAVNAAFSCKILYNESTAATSMQFGIQDVTVAPTSLMVKAREQTGAAAFNAGNLPALTTTTATAIGAAFTPSAATTVWEADIDGMIEQPSNASTSAINIMAQFTTNNGTIKRGSYCRVW